MAIYTYDTTPEQEAAFSALNAVENKLRVGQVPPLQPRTNDEYNVFLELSRFDSYAQQHAVTSSSKLAGDVVEAGKKATPEQKAALDTAKSELDKAVAAILGPEDIAVPASKRKR